MEEEKDLEVMNDLEKQKWKKKLRKEIKKPMKTGRKVAVSAGCLGIAAGLFFTMSDSEVMAKARKAVEETYRSIAVWVGGTPEENDYVQEIYGNATANGREITIVDLMADQDLLQISYQDKLLEAENFKESGDLDDPYGSDKYFLSASLLVEGETVGEGHVSRVDLASDTNIINGSFEIYTGNSGCDLSQIKEGELVLQMYERGSAAGDEWRFSLNLEKRNLKSSTNTQELSETFDLGDGRTLEIYKYAENEGGRKLYAKIEAPEDWNPENAAGDLQITGITDQKEKIKFEYIGEDLYLMDRNIRSAAKSVDLFDVHGGDDQAQLAENDVFGQFLYLLHFEVAQAFGRVFHDRRLGGDADGEDRRHVDADVLPRERALQIHADGKGREV